MQRSSFSLAGALTVTWVVVYVATQVLADPPLSTQTTLLGGLAVTIIVTLAYPSALGGPGAIWRRRAPAARQPRRSDTTEQAVVGGRVQNSTIAAVGKSMPLRSGLTADAARRTAQLVRPMLGVDSVAITDRERVLAFVGPGSDHHTVGDQPQTEATARVLDSGKTIIVRNRVKVGCPEPDCPLETAAVAPLTIGDRIVGTLKVYRLDELAPSRDLVEGMAGILSLHLELAELDRERKFAVDAKLDALRAQINPHFLFNILNTIASKARTDSEEARQLLLRLSDFFRYAVRQDGQLAEFGQEYFFVRTYLALEQARYGDRLRVRYDIDPRVLTAHVPVLTIQPLVENAVKHGLANQVEGGTVSLKARVDPLTRTTAIQVSDDGVGIPPVTLERITRISRKSDGTGDDDGGVGLRNISQRLTTLYGERFQLDVRSRDGHGTVIDLQIPLR